MRIPSKFKMIGRSVDVLFSDELLAEQGNLGLCQYAKSTITLCEKGGKRVPREMMEVVFLHEWLHMALETLGRDDLSVDEKLVDQLSELMYQLLPQIEDKT